MEKSRLTAQIWQTGRPLVGMVHLPPLPGSPGWRTGASHDMRHILRAAVADARILADEGMDGVLVENFHDAPFHPDAVPPETVAAMAVVVAQIADAIAVPVGVNVLRNDAAAALAVAVAAGARFIRVNVHTGAMVTDQGWIEGRAHETLRRRAALGADGSPLAGVESRPAAGDAMAERAALIPAVAILADILVKHAVPPPGLTPAAAARDTWHRGLADALVVSGDATGQPTDATTLDRVREAVPEAAVWIGSGLDPTNAAALLPRADGAIVGSALMRDGRGGSPVDAGRVRALVAAARRS